VGKPVRGRDPLCPPNPADAPDHGVEHV